MMTAFYIALGIVLVCLLAYVLGMLLLVGFAVDTVTILKDTIKIKNDTE